MTQPPTAADFENAGFHERAILQTWFSPAFPIGGFAYSQGLETAAASGLLSDEAGLLEWLTTLIQQGAISNDLILAASAWRAGEGRCWPGLDEAVELAAAAVPAAKIETNRVVVTNVSAREILFALARDAKINIDIGPGIEGVVTLNAIDQTLPQILDRISKQVDMRYTMENGNLFVEADKPYLKTYKIDFINMSRTVSSKIFTSSQIGGSASGTASGGNTASTAISSDTKNDLMNSLVDNVKAILADEDRIRYTERIERRNELAASARGMGSASENSSNPSASNTNSGKGQSGKSGDGV